MEANATLASVQQRVDGVAAVMHDNVNVMVENLDKSSVLEDKSSALAAQAKAFHSTARSTRKHFWWKLCKERLVVVGLVLNIITKGSIGCYETLGVNFAEMNLGISGPAMGVYVCAEITH